MSPTSKGSAFITGPSVDQEKLPPITQISPGRFKAAQSTPQTQAKQTDMDIQTISSRRVAATQAALTGVILKQEAAVQAQEHRFQMMMTQADHFRRQLHSQQADLRNARFILSNAGNAVPSPRPKSSKAAIGSTPPVIQSPSSVQAALRETAYDCMRRERLARLELLTQKQAFEVDRIHADTEAMRQEHERKLDGKKLQVTLSPLPILCKLSACLPQAFLRLRHLHGCVQEAEFVQQQYETAARRSAKNSSSKADNEMQRKAIEDVRKARVDRVRERQRLRGNYAVLPDRPYPRLPRWIACAHRCGSKQRQRE